VTPSGFIRDIRPDGTVIRTWTVSPGEDLHILPGMFEPAGPWERQTGVADADGEVREWRTLMTVPAPAPDTRHTGACCDSHLTPVCCDPMDCAPCCEHCPTCPALHPEFLSWLTDEERRTFAAIAASKGHAALIDPLSLAILDVQAAFRLAHIAAVLDPDRYRDLPEQYYRISTVGHDL